MTKNGRISIIALAAGFVLCLTARIIGIVFFTDIKTGFLVHGSEVAYCLIFYGICAATALLTAAFASNIKADEKLSGKGTLLLGWITVLMAALAAWDGFLNMNAEKPFTPVIIGDFAAAVYIEAVGIFTLVRKRISAGVGFMYSIIGAYFVFRGIASIAQRMAIITVQEYLLEALSVTMGGVFFALFGKIYSGNGEKRSMFFMRLWGAGTAVLTLSSSFGTIFAKLFAPAEISGRITADFTAAQRFFQDNVMSADGNYMMSFVPYVNMAMGIFAAAAVILSLVKAEN